MAYFNFSRLINKYGSTFTVITKGPGCYDDRGDWREGEITQTEKQGAIIGFRESKLNRPEGDLTAQDKALHVLEPIDRALMGAEVIYNGHKYHLTEIKGKDNAKFTGVYSYVLKWVSAFDRGCADA